MHDTMDRFYAILNKRMLVSRKRTRTLGDQLNNLRRVILDYDSTPQNKGLNRLWERLIDERTS